MIVALLLLMVVQTYLLLVIASKRDKDEPSLVPWPVIEDLPMPRFARNPKEPLSNEPPAPWGL